MVIAVETRINGNSNTKTAATAVLVSGGGTHAHTLAVFTVVIKYFVHICRFAGLFVVLMNLQAHNVKRTKKIHYYCPYNQGYH